MLRVSVLSYRPAVVAPIRGWAALLQFLERKHVLLRYRLRVSEKVSTVVDVGHFVQAYGRQGGVLDRGATSGDAMTPHQAGLGGANGLGQALATGLIADQDAAGERGEFLLHQAQQCRVVGAEQRQQRLVADGEEHHGSRALPIPPGRWC